VGRKSKDENRVILRAGRTVSTSQKVYEQKTQMVYDMVFFESFQKELKTDLCVAIDRRDVALFDEVCKEARELMGVTKGRPKTIHPYLQELRQEAKAHLCLYLSQLLGESYSDIWAGYFVNKNQPKKPDSNIPPQYHVRFLCEKYPEAVEEHLFNVLDADTDGQQLLTALLKNTDNK
jgi:hypothetical protein